MEPERDAPPFVWGDRYDLAGLAAGAALLAVLLIAGVTIWVTIALAAMTVNLLAYFSRRRAGVPQMTLWQRAVRRRRASH